MKLCYSLETVPELAGLGRKERMFVLMYYQANKPSGGAPIPEAILVGAIIIGLLAGIFAGATLSTNLTWGPMIGGLAGIGAVACLVYTVSVLRESPKFRTFLRAGHSQMLLASLRQAAGPSTNSNASPQPAASESQQTRSAPDSPLSNSAFRQALNTMNCNISRSTEVLELCTEVAQKTSALFEAATNCERQALRALKRLKFRTSIRAAKEAYNLRQEAHRAFRHSAELFRAGQTNLNEAKALWTGLNEQL